MNCFRSLICWEPRWPHLARPAMPVGCHPHGRLDRRARRSLLIYTWRLRLPERANTWRASPKPETSWPSIPIPTLQFSDTAALALLRIIARSCPYFARSWRRCRNERWGNTRDLLEHLPHLGHVRPAVADLDHSRLRHFSIRE